MSYSNTGIWRKNNRFVSINMSLGHHRDIIYDESLLWIQSNKKVNYLLLKMFFII